MLEYFSPILVFILVFIIIMAILSATKILSGSPLFQFLIAFIISLVVILTTEGRQFIYNLTPAIAVLIIIIFVFLLVLAFTGNLGMILDNKVAGIVLLAIVAVIVIAVSLRTFPELQPYVTQNDTGGNPTLLELKHIVVHPGVAGAIILLIIAAVVTWVLTKG